jgi:hypothetical protein
VTSAVLYAHLFLLHLFGNERAELDELPQARWDRWVPGIIVAQCYAGGDKDPEWRDGLISLGVRFSPSRGIRILIAVLRRGIGHGVGRGVFAVIRAVADAVPFDVFEAGLMKGLRTRRIEKDLYCEGMSLLLAREGKDAIRLIEENVRMIANAEDSELQRRAWNAALLLRYRGSAAWPDLFGIMQACPGVAADLLDALGAEPELRETLADRLSDGELTTLYVWLRRQFGVSPDGSGLSGRPEWVTQDSILSILRKRNRDVSVNALESLAKQFHGEWCLQKVAWEARRELLDSSWVSLDTVLIKKVVQTEGQ